MLTNISLCPMATFILILVIITIILDSYLIFGAKIVPKNNVVLVLALLLIILYAVFTIWLANKTCYNFIWISWLIIIYLVINIINSMIAITDPRKQQELRNEVIELDKKFDETRNHKQGK